MNEKMNEQVNDGGPAFPMKVSMPYKSGHWKYGLPGMSLRDAFAAAALQGDLASQSHETGEYSNSTKDSFLLDRARFYYRFADALLTARAQKGEKV